MLGKLFLLIVMVALHLTAAAYAQDDEWTCDDGDHNVVRAAQTALDEGQLDQAYLLAVEAQSLCAHDFARALQATRLLGQIEQARFGQPPPANSIRPSFPDIPYRSDSAPNQTLDIFIKKGLTGPLPTVILFRGYTATEDALNRKAVVFAGAGLAAVTVEYREPTLYGSWAALEDAFCAAAWVRANATTYGFDPQRIALVGFSQGGTLVATLAAADDPSLFMSDCPSPAPPVGWVRAAAVWAAPILVPDMLADNPRLVVNVSLNYALAEADSIPILETLAGTPPAEWHTHTEWPDATRRVAQTLPFYWIDGREPPFLIAYSEQDEIVPVGEIQALAAILEEAGVNVQIISFPDLHHLDIFAGMETTQITLQFIQSALADTPPE